MVEVPGSAGLVLVGGVVHLDPEAAVFEAMLTGWARQQKSRLLGDATVRDRVWLVRRFNGFAEGYPWAWGPGDVEDFTVSLTSGARRAAPSTIRGYHLSLRMFCDYLTDARYGWLRVCRDRFDQVPSQVCHEWNTVAHLNAYEGRPGRRPLTYGELEALFGHLDGRVGAIVAAGRKGALGALRDAQIFKTAYAFGLRRNELCRLDVADLRPNPHIRRWGMRQWVEQGRELFRPGDHPALWVTERLTRVSLRYLDERFAQLRAEAGLGPDLSLHCLRHSYVTHLVEFGYPERFVQEQVGHAYASTTAIYTSVSNDFKNKTLQAALARVYAPQTQQEPR